MAKVEVLTLEGEVTAVTKEPREYFAEWRAQIERARERRERLLADAGFAENGYLRGHG